MSSLRARLDRLEQQLPDAGTLRLVVVDHAGRILDTGDAEVRPFVGRTVAEVRSAGRQVGTVVGGVDLDVVAGRRRPEEARP